MLERLLAVTSVPVMLMNLFGGIVSGIWLAFLGEWKALGIGVAVLFTGNFIVSMLLLPAMIFVWPGGKLMEKGHHWLGFGVSSIGMLYNSALIISWCFIAFMVFASMSGEHTLWPMLLWSYGIATGTWSYLAMKQPKDGSDIPAILHATAMSISYIICIAAYIFMDASLMAVLAIMILFTGLATIAQLILAALVVNEERKPWWQKNSW